MSEIIQDQVFGPDQLSSMLSRMGFPVSAEEINSKSDKFFEEWGLDSLAMLELVAQLEEFLGAKIEDAQAEALRTSADVFAMFEQRI